MKLDSEFYDYLAESAKFDQLIGCEPTAASAHIG